MPVIVLAHGDGATGPQGWLLDPALLAIYAATGAYLVGVLRVRERRPTSALVAPSRVAAFGTGMGLLTVALSPPLDHAADDLFAAHMIQHLLLGLVAPLALVLARPVPVLVQALPAPLRHHVRRTALVGGRARRASVGLALVLLTAHVVAFSVWHVPALYDAAVDHPVLHATEHLTLLLTGIGLWWVVMTVRWQARSALAVLYLFVVGLPMGALAALLTLAPEPLYQAHLSTAAAWGLTPLEDQQLAGGIMWVPGGLVYLGAASALFVRWLGAGPAPGREVLRWGA